jgi:hypothetical protein
MRALERHRIFGHTARRAQQAQRTKEGMAAAAGGDGAGGLPRRIIKETERMIKNPIPGASRVSRVSRRPSASERLWIWTRARPLPWPPRPAAPRTRPRPQRALLAARARAR